MARFGRETGKRTQMVLRRVLWIGNHRHREFFGAADWLESHALLNVAAAPAAALAALQYPAQPPELILIAQARPDQFAQAEIEAVHRLAPLARLALLAGSWCEGEMRTGHPWPGVLRLYWHQGEARLRELLAEANPLWSYPRTATEVERLLDLQAPPATGANRLIAIGAETSIDYHGLAATCRQAGYATAWVAPHQLTMIQGAAAGIWDEKQQPAPARRSAEPDRLAAFAALLEDAPIVALVNFPRLVDYRRLQAGGVRRVIAKPFMNTDLIGVIEQELVAPERPAQLAFAS